MAIDVVTEEIASNLEEVAEATRSLTAYPAGFFFAGLITGAAIGFYYGHRMFKEKIRDEAFRESQAELEKIREEYQIRTAAVRKPAVDDLIKEKGYVPASSVPEPEVVEVDPRVDGDWNWEEEIASRNPDEPYVIHLREFEEPNDGYSRVNYTYYAGDDVLVDEDEHPLPHGDLIVGQQNLKFGHGTEDPDTVFVRNDKLELLMEISRSPGIYEEDVLGLENQNAPNSD